MSETLRQNWKIYKSSAAVAAAALAVSSVAPASLDANAVSMSPSLSANAYVRTLIEVMPLSAGVSAAGTYDLYVVGWDLLPDGNYARKVICGVTVTVGSTVVTTAPVSLTSGSAIVEKTGYGEEGNPLSFRPRAAGNSTFVVDVTGSSKITFVGTNASAGTLTIDPIWKPVC